MCGFIDEKARHIIATRAEDYHFFNRYPQLNVQIKHKMNLRSTLETKALASSVVLRSTSFIFSLGAKERYTGGSD